MKVFDKNGNRYTYVVLSFNTKSNLEDAFFKFDKKSKPGVVEIDLR